MAKIIFKILLKLLAVFSTVCLLVAVGAITWSGVKEAWIKYWNNIGPIMDEYM